MSRKQMKMALEDFPKDKMVFQLLKNHADMFEEDLLRSNLFRLLDDRIIDYKSESKTKDLAFSVDILLDMLSQQLRRHIDRVREFH